MDQLTLVEEAYWDLAFAARNLDVLNNALGQARAQVESNGRQVTQGTLAPIDVVEAQTQVSRFEQAVASGQQALTSAENRLKRLILANRTAQAWNQPLVPADLAERSAPPIVLDEAVKLALAKRPELKALDITRSQNEIDRAYFKNQTKPQLNVVGGYTLSGLSGDPLDEHERAAGRQTTPTRALRAAERALAPRQARPDRPAHVIGHGRRPGFLRRRPGPVTQQPVRAPLSDRAGPAADGVFRCATGRRGRIWRARRSPATQLERQRQQLEQVIESEVRDAMQAVRSSEQRFDAASSQRRYALEQYESERRRFDSGLSTVFLVLERQTTYVTSQALELRARADLNQAIAQLERAIGGTLEWHGIKLQQ